MVFSTITRGSIHMNLGFLSMTGRTPLSSIGVIRQSPQQQDGLLPKQTHQLLYEGSSKNLYLIERPEHIVQEFKLSPSDAKRKTKFKNVGVVRNEISSYLFEYLEGFHIPTHFIRRISNTEMVVKRLEIVPVVAKVYNVATGHLAKRFEVKEGTSLAFPIIEHYYKNDEMGNPWLNEFHIYSFNMATPEEFRLINRLASKVNAVLRALCDRRDLLLATITLEFGRHKGQILVGDEISPATCQFWNRVNASKLDRDAFRIDRPNAEEMLTELSARIIKTSQDRL
jgi:phosphoribosylaminoimidazole-succinocarboxamide synthase